MFKRLIYGIASVFLVSQLFAQTPDMYPPPDPQPVEVTTLNIVLYIVLPIILIVAFILYRKSVKKKQQNKH